MKKMMVAAGFLLAAITAMAQEAPQVLSVITVKVKPDANTEFQGLLREYRSATQKAGAPFLSVWQSGALGEGNLYMAVAPLAKFAEFDKAPAIVEAMGEGAYERWIGAVRRSIVDIRREAIVLRHDLSIQSEFRAAPRLAYLLEVTVAPGRQYAYETFLKSEALPAIRKGDVADFWIHQAASGVTPRYLIIWPLESYSALDEPPPLVKALGPEGAQKILEKVAGIVTKYDASVIQYNSELSFGREPELQ
jgi:hypothetical protein